MFHDGPAAGDRNSLTIGADGPILLHDVHFLEQMAHFNREKVPERQPHAKGAGAFGAIETTDTWRDVRGFSLSSTNNPEGAHQVTYLMGPRGLPRTWRHMNGYGSHTYMWINGSGEKFWVQYHFHTQQGMEFFSNAEAQRWPGSTRTTTDVARPIDRS